MYLLDTKVVSELRKAKSGKADANAVAWTNSVNAASLFLSAVAVLELEMGVLAKERSDPAQGTRIACLNPWEKFKHDGVS